MEGLTDRQRQVAAGLADGKSARQIGEELGIGLGTVEQHRHNTYKALGITNITDLVKWALANGLVRNKYARGRPRKER